MGIRTKFNPMGGASGKKYKAYLLVDGVATDVATLGFTENINPDKCFGSTKSSVTNRYVILNGKLFWYHDYTGTLNQIGNYNTWTAVEGVYSTNYSAFGIADGKLYKISNTAEQIGSLTNCTALGTCPLMNGSFMYFIANGKLFYLTIGSTGQPVQVGSDTDWTDITGYYYRYGASTNSYALGTKSNGTLYWISGTTIVTGSSGFNKTSNGAFYWDKNDRWSTIYVITNNGRLVYFGNANVQTAPPQNTGGYVGTLDTWTDVSGYYSSGDSIYCYGIADGKLYRIASTGEAQVGSLTSWTSVSGVIKSNKYYAYGISNNELYLLEGLTPTKLLDNCLKVYGFGTGLAICEA